jgi:hypothetical protein
MLKRLLLGLVIGLIVGALIAGVAVEGLGMLTFAGTGGAALAYVFAAVTGVLVGLVAGKPIWARGGQIEAGLKAFFGALLGAGLMFALRSWVSVPLDLDFIHAGHGLLGNLPAASLPVIAMLLGGFYELDNTPAPEEDGKKGDKSSDGAAKKKKNVRVAAAEAESDEDEEPAASNKKMKR